MTVIDLSNNRTEGGFFILNNRRTTPFEWRLEENDKCQFLGTYRDSVSPLRDTLLRLIRDAKRRVFVASFMVGDEALIQELIDAAERLRGGVYLITALDVRSLTRGLSEYEDQEQDAPEERRKNFERLTSHGVYVRGHESCHAKFAVADNAVALIGSANFVTNGFEWTGEADIVVCNPVQVGQLARLFTQLWYEGCRWEVPPGVTYVVAERSPRKSPARPDELTGASGEIVWTNGPQETSLLDAIHMTIETAREELILSTYSLVKMHDNPSLLFDRLRGAVERGVHARLFIRQRNAWPEQMKEVIAAHDMGVEVYADLRNHAKVVIADERKAVVFSANFDADHGLNNGVEAGVCVYDEPAVNELVRYMEHVIAHADTRFARNPTMTELNGCLAARWCSAWPLENECAISCSQEAFERFAREAASGPCLYEECGDGRMRLHAGLVSMEISLHNSRKAEVTSSEGEISALDRLNSWMPSVRAMVRDSSKRRGFCPARLVNQGVLD